MWKSAPTAVLLLVLLLLTGALPPQQRVKPAEARDFPATLAAAEKHWSAGHYGECLTELQAAVALVTQKRATAIVAALPAAAAGWEAVPDTSRLAVAENPALAQALAASMAIAGSVVQHEYRQQGGSGRVQVTVTADSPMVSTFAMWIANPAALERGSELIQYEAHKAVLKSQGGALVLEILIHGRHLCAVNARGLTEEQLFALFDQKAVDALAAVLGA